MIEALTLAVPELGNRTYLIHDGAVAVVVDPQRDIHRVITAAATAGLRIVFVAETHIHNDYVSGGYTPGDPTGRPLPRGSRGADGIRASPRARR